MLFKFELIEEYFELDVRIMAELKKIQNDECKNRNCANINCDIEGEVWDPETHKCICDSEKHMVIIDGACICKPGTLLQWDNNLEG